MARANRMDEIEERTTQVRSAIIASTQPYTTIIRKAGICQRTLYDIIYYGHVPAKDTLDAIEKGLRK